MRKPFSNKSPLQKERNTDRERQQKRRSSFLFQNPFRLFRLHPLFLIVGVWYAFTGELFLFLLSALVAVQHECAHAFAAYKLGYKLNAIVLMPFGAVIDGDMKGISFKDEIYVALCGPFCNLITAVFFVALWWFIPTMYAFTDTVFYASLSIALVNFLPAYPLDGGRVLYCLLVNTFSKTQTEQAKAEAEIKKNLALESKADTEYNIEKKRIETEDLIRNSEYNNRHKIYNGMSDRDRYVYYTDRLANEELDDRIRSNYQKWVNDYESSDTFSRKWTGVNGAEKVNNVINKAMDKGAEAVKSWQEAIEEYDNRDSEFKTRKGKSMKQIQVERKNKNENK